MNLSRALAGVAVFIVTTALQQVGLAGELNPPPGPVGPTYKSLDQVRPGTPLTSVPVTLNAPGNYFLVGDLVHAGPGPAISVTASNVTLDLGGFTLAGPGPSSGLSGVQAGGLSNLRVLNGSVESFGIGVNVSSGRGVEIRSLRLRNNGFGVYANASHIVDCTAVENTRVGFTTLSALFFIPGNGTFTSTGACVVERCAALANAEGGFSLAEGTQLVDSTASLNKRYGVTTTGPCRVERCSISRTLADGAGYPGIGVFLDDGGSITDSEVSNCDAGGIQLANRCTVRACNVSSNGQFGVGAPSDAIAVGTGANRCTITDCDVSLHTASGGTGISVSGWCLVQDNACRDNKSYGIYVGPVGGSNRVRDNHCSGNGLSGAAFTAQIVVQGVGSTVEGNSCTSGPSAGMLVFGSRNIIVRNSAGGNPGGNFSIGAGNNPGPIIDRSGGGSPITSSDASANISF